MVKIEILVNAVWFDEYIITGFPYNGSLHEKLRNHINESFKEDKDEVFEYTAGERQLRASHDDKTKEDFIDEIVTDLIRCC